MYVNVNDLLIYILHSAKVLIRSPAHMVKSGPQCKPDLIKQQFIITDN